MIFAFWLIFGVKYFSSLFSDILGFLAILPEQKKKGKDLNAWKILCS